MFKDFNVSINKAQNACCHVDVLCALLSLIYSSRAFFSLQTDTRCIWMQTTTTTFIADELCKVIFTIAIIISQTKVRLFVNLPLLNRFYNDDGTNQ